MTSSEVRFHGASRKGLEESNQELLTVSKYLTHSLRNSQKTPEKPLKMPNILGYTPILLWLGVRYFKTAKIS